MGDIDFEEGCRELIDAGNRFVDGWIEARGFTVEGGAVVGPRRLDQFPFNSTKGLL